jgi:molecular chaperone GrpE
LVQEVTVTEPEGKEMKIPVNDDSRTSVEPRDKAVEARKHSEPAPLAGAAGTQPEGKPEVDPLEAARKESAENRDRWVRAVADLENYKKRTVQEKSRLLKYRNEELLRDLLPVLDNMERAMAHCDQESRSDPLVEGVCLVAGMLREALKKHGINEIEALGKPFDPHFHEAVAQRRDPGKAANKVVEELEKGYMYEDRLLRPAKVVVSTDQGE